MTALAYKQADYVAIPQPQSHLRVLTMPNVKHMGEVYDTPLCNGMKPHPQAEPSYDMFDVQDAGDDSGTYVVFMIASPDGSIRNYFPKAAHKLCTRPPQKKGNKPIYGCDEAGFDPDKDEPIDLSKRLAVYGPVTLYIKQAFPNAQFNLV